MGTKTIALELSVKLNDSELAEIGRHIADLVETIDEIEAERKKIPALRKEILELSKKISQGYELRNVECVVHLDSPTIGMKRIIRTDTNEVVLTEPMSDEELQEELALDTTRGGVVIPFQQGEDDGTKVR
jgi:hypothetical protein